MTYRLARTILDNDTLGVTVGQLVRVEVIKMHHIAGTHMRVWSPGKLRTAYIYMHSSHFEKHFEIIPRRRFELGIY